MKAGILSIIALAALLSFTSARFAAGAEKFLYEHGYDVMKIHDRLMSNIGDA